MEKVSPCLQKLFGSRPYTNRDWSDNRIIGSGDDARYYYIENCFVSEDNKHLAGSYLIIRDNTEEHRKMQQELYHSTHDALTDLYTKQHLFERIRTVLDQNLNTTD